MDRSKDSTQGHVIHSLDSNSVSIIVFAAILVGALALGTLGGFSLSKVTKSTPKTISGAKDSEKTVGVVDKKKFPDTADGTLREGGLDDEGSFHLERPGGDSQNVYLTSSVVDLSEFLGKKIRVGGQTFQGQKAGWLMDVGYVEVLK